MEKERKIKTLSLVALIVAILGLTVAFAALSQTLTINGTANVNTATWDIHFENLNSVYLNGAQINKEPVLNQTVISNIDVTLTKPDDVATFSVDMVNDGSIDAKISSVEVSPLCEASSPVSSCDWDNDGVVTEQDIKKGTKSYDQRLSYIKNALEERLERQFGKHIEVSIYADLVDIHDLRWSNAIEGLLFAQKFNLFVAPKYYDDAYKILRNLLT